MQVIFVNKAARKFHHFPTHSHPNWEVILTTAGHGSQMIDGKAYPFYPGKIVYIPPNTPHCSNSEDGFTDACVFFRDFTPLDKRKIGEFCDDSDGNFLYLVNLTYDVLQKNVPNAQALANALGDAMYQLLISWNGENQKNTTFIESFQNLLIQNISNVHFDLSKAIDDTGFCKGYFRRVFREVTGQSPVKYFNGLRIEYAKRQLAQYHSVFTIREVSAFSGFKDPYHFSKVFKKYENISPTEYVELIKKQEIRKIGIPENFDYNKE